VPAISPFGVRITTSLNRSSSRAFAAYQRGLSRTQGGRGERPARKPDPPPVEASASWLTYGIGVARPVLHSNPQSAVRAYEVVTITVNGQHRYVVAIDIAGKPM
jgi:hypothetical protein